MAEKRPALGKGLSALIPEVPEPRPAAGLEVDIELLVPSRFQPRVRVDDARLEELADSIRANGVLQPIIVRKVDGTYQIVAGERRWRAAQRAGLLRVPVVVREAPPGDDGKLLEWALIENLQREDLNPIQEAQAYRRLLDEFHYTQEQVARAVGKDRSSVANTLRLLKLPESVREEVAAGRLSMGHARALLGLGDGAAASRAAREIIGRDLSVRQAESLVRRLAGTGKKRGAGRTVDVHTRAAEERLSRALGTRVRIVRRRKGGRIEVQFTSEDELQRLYEVFTGR
jgi:ParB family transcriptional regulator, chromosome partitioning protein